MPAVEKSAKPVAVTISKGEGDDKKTMFVSKATAEFMIEKADWKKDAGDGSSVTK